MYIYMYIYIYTYMYHRVYAHVTPSHYACIYRLLAGVTTSQTRNLRPVPREEKGCAGACSPVRPVRRPSPDSSGVVSLTPDAHSSVRLTSL